MPELIEQIAQTHQRQWTQCDRKMEHHGRLERVRTIRLWVEALGAGVTTSINAMMRSDERVYG